VEAEGSMPSPKKVPLSVLIVDDDESVRNLTSLMLQRAGYKVFTASNGLEAIETLVANPDLHGVIMDLLMPVMSGEEAFQKMKDLRPSVRIIIVSGVSDEELYSRFDRSLPDGILQKPFTLGTLTEVVSCTLN
jgi:two-component system cell cycle sensor histidine kinase/response regulator CckA